MKMDVSVLDEYVRISTPNKERLAELVERAKGPNLNMAQFAKKCEVNPSTLSRIVNKKTAGKNSDLLILKIAKNADPDSDVTLEMLMSAHGMKKRNLSGKVDTQEYIAFQKNATELVLSEIVKRGYKVQLPPYIQSYNALNFRYSPDWEIETDAVTEDGSMGQWIFECWTMLGTEQQAIKQQAMKLKQKLLMLLGLYYMGEIKAEKLSFIVFNRRFYELLKKTLEGIKLKPWITIMLFNMEIAEFIDEFTFPAEDGSVRKEVMEIPFEEPVEEAGEDLFADLNGRNQLFQ